MYELSVQLQDELTWHKDYDDSIVRISAKGKQMRTKLLHTLRQHFSSVFVQGIPTDEEADEKRVQILVNRHEVLTINPHT